MEDAIITVEANLYGGTFRLAMTPKAYGINLAGETACTDMRVTNTKTRRTFTTDQWSSLPPYLEVISGEEE